MVAAAADLSRFRCSDCAEAESRGGDLKRKYSGEPGSCRGPKTWTFAGEIAWRGCPRLAWSSRVGTWLAYHARTGGRLTLTELNRCPSLLLDAFAAIEEAQALRARHADEMRKKQYGRGPNAR